MACGSRDLRSPPIFVALPLAAGLACAENVDEKQIPCGNDNKKARFRACEKRGGLEFYSFRFLF